MLRFENGICTKHIDIYEYIIHYNNHLNWGLFNHNLLPESAMVFHIVDSQELFLLLSSEPAPFLFVPIPPEKRQII